MRHSRVGKLGAGLARATVALAAVILVMAGCGDSAPTTAPVGPGVTGGMQAIGTDPVTGATIETNRDDYSPGEVVHLAGRGWAPNETVHLYMSEDPDTHGDVSQDVVADSAGMFNLHFYDVQVHDLGVTFTLTATGGTSGSRAVVVFTDGRNVNAIALTPASPFAPATSVSVDLDVVLNTGTGAQVWKGTRWAILNASNAVILSSSPSCVDTPDHSVNDPDEFSGNKHRYTFSFSAPTPGTYTLRVGVYSTDNCASASDSTGGSTSFTVASSNQPPTAAFSNNGPVNEGSAFQLSLTNPQDDATPIASLTFAFDCGAGAGYGAFSSTSTASCPTTDNGTRNVKAKVKDGGNLETEYTASVTVDNVAPTATFGASPNSANLGGSFTVSLTAPVEPSTVDAASLEYAFNCGTVYGAYSTTNSATCAGTTIPSQVVKGKIKDKDGGENEYTSSVAVNNVAPDAIAGGPYTFNEGSSVNLAGSGSDPDGGTVTFLWEFTAPNTVCTIATPTSATSSVSCTDEGSFTLRLTVTDDEAATKAVTTGLTVANVAPSVSLSGGSAANEGDTKSYSYNFTDPGADTWTHAASCGSSGVLSNDTFNGGTKSGSFDCTWTDEASNQSVSVTVDDGDGGADSDAVTVTVANVAPVVSLTGTTPVNEGTTTTYSYTFTDPGTDAWEQTVSCGANGTLSNDVLNAGTRSGSFKCTWADEYASQVVSVSIDDKDGGVDTDAITVTVNNVAPVVTLIGPNTANEGDAKSYSYSFTDPGADTWTQTPSCGANGTVSNAAFNAGTKQGSFDCTWTNDYASQSVSATVNDNDGGEDTGAITVAVSNVAPIVTLIGPNTANEGDTKSYSYSFTDPGADAWTRVVSCGANGVVSNDVFNGGTKSGTFDCKWVDDYSSAEAVTATVNDDDAPGSGTVNVTVSNVKPTITALTLPVLPVPVNTSTNLTVSFTDPAGVNDAPYKAYVKWDDDAVYGSPVAISSGGTIARTFTTPGVYTVCVQVEDDYPAKSDEVCSATYIVVYDPNGGFVTGGGWINSPAGAYKADLSLVGKANFGFVSKYLKGATVPTGNTEFQFHAASLNFKSVSYQWLVVNQNGANAQFKGTGKINGAGSYTFMLWATDGSTDTFRIQITDDNNANAVVYDNGVNQAIAGGSIQIKVK